MSQGKSWAIILIFSLIAAVALIGCSGSGGNEATATVDSAVVGEDHDDHEQESDHDHDESHMLFLPALEPAELNGEQLKVVATTSIIGDVVAKVGGEHIDLTILMESGQDPHSFEPTARDLRAVSDADIIFVNGWDLEEGLIDDLANVGGGIPMVAVAARLEPREMVAVGDHDDPDHGHASIDPHTWLNPENVMQWAANIKIILSDLDPTNAPVYDQNGDRYKDELALLVAYIEEQTAKIPADGRNLVTNHASFGYFADRFNFKVVGTVLPASSTLADPSASGLAQLIEIMEEANVCTLFIETTANNQLAQAAADELQNCAMVRILSLYTGALGAAGSGAEDYISMMKSNVDTIVDGLIE